MERIKQCFAENVYNIFEMLNFFVSVYYKTNNEYCIQDITGAHGQRNHISSLNFFR